MVEEVKVTKYKSKNGHVYEDKSMAEAADKEFEAANRKVDLDKELARYEKIGERDSKKMTYPTLIKRSDHYGEDYYLVNSLNGQCRLYEEVGRELFKNFCEWGFYTGKDAPQKDIIEHVFENGSELAILVMVRENFGDGRHEDYIVSEYAKVYD